MGRGKVVGISLGGGAAGGFIANELIDDLVEFFKNKNDITTTQSTANKENMDAMSL